VALEKQLAIGMLDLPTRQLDRPPVNLLQSVQQHRPVRLQEHRRFDLNPILGRDGKKVLVVRGVMDLAHCEAVRHHGLTAERVGKNVCGIEQRRVLEPANCALRLVRAQHLTSEDRLVQSLSREPLDIASLGNGIHPVVRCHRPLLGVYQDCEIEPEVVPPSDEDRYTAV
jgi:hypothetical protein